MPLNRLLKVLPAATLLAALAVQSTLFAQGALVVAVPTPTTDTGIALAPANAAAVSTPSAPAAWGGERTGNEATLSDRVADSQIEATLAPEKHTIDGKQKLTWRNRSSQPVRVVYMHLYLNGFQNANSTFFTEQRNTGGGAEVKDGKWGYIELRGVQQNGAAVNWSFVQPDGGPASDHPLGKMALPQAGDGGARTTRVNRCVDQLPRAVSRTGYVGSFHLVAQWFPKMAVLELPGERGATHTRWNAHEFHAESEFYADFGSYDVKLTAPKEYRIGATGELQGAPVEKDGKLTHHFVQGDVHDFAWTADKHSAEPLVDTWTGPGSPQVKITVLFPPEYRHNAAPAMKAAKDSLSYFSNTLGPYPYKTLTVVIPPYNAREAAGMEYPTFFTADSYDDLTPGTFNAGDLDFVTIHEFGHGYFYGILASNEFEEPMLDEGLNEYWDQRMLRDSGQKLNLTNAILKRIGVAPAWDLFHYERMGAVLENPADPVGENAYGRLQGIGPAYSRTAVMMRDLEAQVGKEAMERAFKEYYKRWKFRHPSVADLRETIAEVTGQRQLVEKVFAQQVYSVNKVDDRISSFVSEEQVPQPGYIVDAGKRVERTAAKTSDQEDEMREQWDKAHPDAKPGTGPFPFRTEVILRRRGVAVPQTLVVKFADGSKETVQWNGEERWKRFEWTKPVKAVSAELDPERKNLLDTSKLDDSRTLKADNSATRRWTFDFAALVQTLIALIATV
jgi:hypothetical protein